MKTIPIAHHPENFPIVATVTQMREGAEFGATNPELRDGNMLPRLCMYAGKEACAQACQFRVTVENNDDNVDAVGKLCASNNILATLQETLVRPENFAVVACTKDRVGFGDAMQEMGATTHEDGYMSVPDCNAFFFRPGRDITPNGKALRSVGMRMADCGDVVYSFVDSNDKPVVGIAHFSRTNMRGPSAYTHELNGQKVSWAEFVLGNAVEHYGVDPASIKVRLVAAVEGKDFIHHYSDKEKMEAHYPGWEELGFMHPAGDTDFDCLIDYREMIQWQLANSVQEPTLRVPVANISVEGAINTGDPSLGYASHHAASKNEIAHGRDMYMVGFKGINFSVRTF